MVSIFLALCLSQAPAPARQSSTAARPPQESDATIVARGWADLAAGRPIDASRLAQSLLAKKPWSHPAIELEIAARSEQQPLAGLDAYERWLGKRPDDPGLLEPVAVAVLHELASNRDSTISAEAARFLALPTRKTATVSDLPRLEAALQTDVPDKTAIARALGEIGPAGAPTLIKMLRTTSGPSRAAAAAALGSIGQSDAETPLLEAMQDSDGYVKAMAAVALARLGNAAGADYVKSMLESPVGDVRLMAALGWNGAPGPWVDAVRPVLQDPNPVSRMKAAELLAPIDPEAARPVLAAGLGDDNPAVRAQAEQALSEASLVDSTLVDIPRLRHNLREADAFIRLYAAGTLVALVRAPQK